MNTLPKGALTLVADVGGTNTRVALADGLSIVDGSIAKLANAKFNSLEDVLGHYMANAGGAECATICVAVAGPVRGDIGELTNLEWTFSEQSLCNSVGAQKAFILNDLQAQGHALPFMDPAKIKTIWPGNQPEPNATRLVLGVGTGINAAPVLSGRNGTVVAPSESGHVSLPVQNKDQADLAAYMNAHFGFASVEEALSGRGIENIYAWLASREGTQARLNSAAIFDAAETESDPLAREALRHFIELLGATAGDLCLIQLPFGGVYLIGGMARAVSPYFDEYEFVKHFQSKGRFSEFMSAFPVHVVEDDFAALFGCASFASQQQS